MQTRQCCAMLFMVTQSRQMFAFIPQGCNAIRRFVNQVSLVAVKALNPQQDYTRSLTRLNIPVE